MNTARSPDHRPIRHLRIGFAALALILITAAAMFAYYSWRMEKHQEAIHLASLVEMAGNSLDNYFDGHSRSLQRLADQLVIKGQLVDSASAQVLMRKFKDENPDFLHIVISQLDGRLLATEEMAMVSGLMSVDNISFRMSIEALKTERGLNVARVFHGAFSKAMILPLRIGIRDADGNLKYVLGASLPMSRQQVFWQNVPLPPESAFGIVRDDGYLISSFPEPRPEDYDAVYGQPRKSEAWKYYESHNFPTRGVLESYNNVVKANSLFGFRRLTRYPLTVIVSTPTASIADKWAQQVLFPILLSATLLLGGYALYRWLSRRQLAWENERASNENRIQFMAHHDSLTGLPNRLLFNDRLEQALAHAEREQAKVALVFADLDNFKHINDSLGHAIGDLLLQQAVERLRQSLRGTDTLGRQGGDEFLALLVGLHEPEAVVRVIETMRERLSSPFVIEGHELSVTLSIGIAIYPDDGNDFDTLLRKADTAMYEAKASGRDAYRFFTEYMNVDAEERLRMRHWLVQALEQEHFVLHYQPQIDLTSGAITGAEALIRLNRPGEGLIPPSRFIDLAENSGLIVPMGTWILRQACREAAAWRQAGHTGVSVAVNLSAVQFKRGNVEKCVTDALLESGLPPACLALELTETILIDNAESILTTVRRLKEIGVRFAIDDFGIGYSNLSYLKRFSVDKLKIDQSFVRDILNDPDDAAIVMAVVQMARSLRIRTIAEGVEDEATHLMLTKLQCDEAQGYFFGRPMPPEAFRQYLAAPHTWAPPAISQQLVPLD